MTGAEKEQTKLINVMRRLARSAHFAALGRAEPDAAAFCVAQYNRTLSRLAALEPMLSTLYPPLAPMTAPEVVSRMAQAIIAYFEAESSARSQTVDFSLLDILRKATGRGI